MASRASIPVQAYPPHGIQAEQDPPGRAALLGGRLSRDPRGSRPWTAPVEVPQCPAFKRLIAATGFPVGPSGDSPCTPLKEALRAILFSFWPPEVIFGWPSLTAKEAQVAAFHSQLFFPAAMFWHARGKSYALAALLSWCCCPWEECPGPVLFFWGMAYGALGGALEVFSAWASGSHIPSEEGLPWGAGLLPFLQRLTPGVCLAREAAGNLGLVVLLVEHTRSPGRLRRPRGHRAQCPHHTAPV